MSPRNLGPSALLAGAAMLAFAPSLLAQSADGVRPMPEGQPATGDRSTKDDDTAIVVTGTRIRGARATGEVITIDREAITEAGQIDLGEAIRSLPQNFGGGQNPGVGPGSGPGTNENVNSASSANLRGLGADATLTLLNGHRLPYDSVGQGIDISAIPLAAVERVEVVPDGASALYGSDAVGGIVNVILRRDVEGVTTSAQIGASTEGGNFRQQADIVGGTRWNGGGVVVAYDFVHNSPIRARQRDYTASLLPSATLYPGMQRHAVTLFAHHAIAPGVEASLDALYSTRKSEMKGGTEQRTSLRKPRVESFTLAPSLKAELGGGWQASLAGVFGRDRTHYHTTFVPLAGASLVASGHYFNEVTSFEGGLEGPLFSLPGGDARLAVGAGIRTNRLNAAQDSVGFSSAVKARQRARFAYGELYLPFVSPDNDLDGIRELSLSAALRYENYSDFKEIATPRVGLSWSPLKGLVLRGSWARSFKAPVLFRQYTFSEAYLLPAAPYGAGTGSDTVLYTSGGNPDLGPERARSWTAGFEFRPVFVEGLSVSATWYDIDYRDRVATPLVGGLRSAFGNPGYADQITLSPDSATLADIIALAPFGLENFTGAPYDPSTVVALVDDRETNIGEWSATGVDALISYTAQLGEARSFGMDVAASWLDSRQRVTPALPGVDLSGTIFSPPRLRMRGSARFQTGSFTVNGAINYTGKLIDSRSSDAHRLAPNATIDLGLRYSILKGEARDPGLEISLTIQNLFDDKPEAIGRTGPTDTPYDSTNYSPIGRFVAFGIRRHW